MGAVFTVRTRRRGFYPRGDGVVDLLCNPLEKKLKPLTLLDRGEVKSVTIKRYVSNLPTRPERPPSHLFLTYQFCERSYSRRGR